jgi:hypothetical protein
VYFDNNNVEVLVIFLKSKPICDCLNNGNCSTASGNCTCQSGYFGDKCQNCKNISLNFIK